MMASPLKTRPSFRVCFALACLVPGFLTTNAKGDSITVEVNRVVYNQGSNGQARITIDVPAVQPGTYQIKPRLEYGLDQTNTLSPTVINPSVSNEVNIAFTVPPNDWGYALVAELCLDGVPQATSNDVFAVGTNPFRLGQINNHGGSLPNTPGTLDLFANDDSFWPAKWRQTKGTWLEIFAGLLCEFSGLDTDLDEWITMQAKFRMSKAGISAYTEAAHRLGLKVMTYNNATPSGWWGADWARGYPEWLHYDYLGGMLASMSVRDLEKQKQWHVTLSPEPEVGSFQQLHLNFYDPLVIEFGSDQLLGVADELGYDGVRFDGHWMIGDVWSGISFGMDGRRPNRGESLDEINRGNIDHMKQYIRASKPDYLFGYNYGNNYESGGARNPDAYRAACQDGGMILWEGAAHGEAFSEWRAGALKLRENSLRVHQSGGVHYGQILGPSSSTFPNIDFYQRYIYINNFAALSHIYGTVYFEHPGYLPIQGLYYRFALRYGELLFDAGLQPILTPTNHLAVTVGGVEDPDLWWKPYTYKLQRNGTYYIISHLVNMPAEGLRKEDAQASHQPAPLMNVQVDFSNTPDRVVLLDPEAASWIEFHGSTSSITIAELPAWKMVVQEFPGTCAHIPTETIPEGDFQGADILPDPMGGTNLLPVTTLLTGTVPGTAIPTGGANSVDMVADPSAQFGQAFRCLAAGVSQPTPLLFGPSQVMPSAAPGDNRITWRLKVADNTSGQTVCTVGGTALGDQTIRANDFAQPGIYQEFSYDYPVEEDSSNYMTLTYHGVTDLWVDNLTSYEVDPVQDVDWFSPGSLDVSGLPLRTGVSKKGHLCRGLWHEYFGFDAALNSNGMTIAESWDTLNTDHATIPAELPITVSDTMENDLLALLNVSARSLQPVRRKNLREYVLRGGILFVGGGPRAFGHGGYKNTFLEDLLPVTCEKFDLKKAESNALNVVAGDPHPITDGVSFASGPVNHFYHDVTAKPGATVLLKTGTDVPLLTTWGVGDGTVYAFTGTPLGPTNAPVWWQWAGWNTILDRVVADASPGTNVTYLAESNTEFGIVAHLPGTNDLFMTNGLGQVIAPTETNGVWATPQGVSCGYNEPDEGAPGNLIYEGQQMIYPEGSITFKIRPGWDVPTDGTPVEQADITESTPLLVTQSATHGGQFLIYIFVHKASGNITTVAMGFHVHTNDEGTGELTSHSVFYPIMMTHGGLRDVKKSLWQQGEEYEVTVDWTSSQMVLRENGEVMNAMDFVPEMDLSSFTGPLYVGSSLNGKLSRVLLKDVIIQSPLFLTPPGTGIVTYVDEDFADIGDWASSGGSVAALDTETDGRTVLADGDTFNDFVEVQRSFAALELFSNTNNLESFTVDTVFRQNQPAGGAPKTIFFDLRDNSTTDGVGVFQRLTAQYRSSDGFFQIDEFEGTDSLKTTHFSGFLGTPFPSTDSAADYSTLRFDFDYAASQFTVSTIINSVETGITTFSLDTTSGVFDRMRYRFQAQTSGTLPADSPYFVDSVLIYSTAPTGGPPGIVVTTGLVDDVMIVDFDSENGRSYQLEYTTNNMDWFPANFTIQGNGQSITAFDPTGPDSDRIYRIVTLP